MKPLDDIYYYLQDNLAVAINNAKIKGIENKGFDFWKGYLVGVQSVLGRLVANTLAFNNEQSDIITYFHTEQEAEKYAYDEERVIDELTAAFNNMIYKEIYPNIELLEVGKTHVFHIKAYGLLHFGEEEYPIYDDDAGQCEYIRLNGENYSAGSYNFSPEYDFIIMIINYKIKNAIEKIKDFYKE